MVPALAAALPSAAAVLLHQSSGFQGGHGIKSLYLPIHHFAPNPTFSLHIAELTWSNLPFAGSAVEDGIVYYVQDVIAFNKRISTFTTLPQHNQSQAPLTRAAI